MVRNWHSVDDRNKQMKRETRLLHLADRPEMLRSFTTCQSSCSPPRQRETSRHRSREKSRHRSRENPTRREKHSGERQKYRRSSSRHSRSRSTSKRSRSPVDSRSYSKFSSERLTVTTLVSKKQRVKLARLTRVG